MGVAPAVEGGGVGVALAVEGGGVGVAPAVEGGGVGVAPEASHAMHVIISTCMALHVGLGSTVSHRECNPLKTGKARPGFPGLAHQPWRVAGLV